MCNRSKNEQRIPHQRKIFSVNAAGRNKNKVLQQNKTLLYSHEMKLMKNKTMRSKDFHERFYM